MKLGIFIRNGTTPWRAFIIHATHMDGIEKKVRSILPQNFPKYKIFTKHSSVRIIEVADNKRTFLIESIKDIKGVKRLLYFDISNYYKNQPRKKRRFYGSPADFHQEDVEACKDKKLDAALFKNYSRCPQCKTPPEKLTWIDFKSPTWTWPAKCGKEGPLSWCPNCMIQVEFILKRLS